MPNTNQPSSSSLGNEAQNRLNLDLPSLSPRQESSEEAKWRERLYRDFGMIKYQNASGSTNAVEDYLALINYVWQYFPKDFVWLKDNLIKKNPKVIKLTDAEINRSAIALMFIFNKCFDDYKIFHAFCLLSHLFERYIYGPDRIALHDKMTQATSNELINIVFRMFLGLSLDVQLFDKAVENNLRMPLPAR